MSMWHADFKCSSVVEPLKFQKDFFQLKELEKRHQKEKGITSMSAKEIMTSLVVNCLKIMLFI